MYIYIYRANTNPHTNKQYKRIHKKLSARYIDKLNYVMMPFQNTSQINKLNILKENKTKKV